METPKTRTTLKVTINPDANSDFVLSGWPINTHLDIMEEPERVSVEKGSLSYSLVFPKVGRPFLEIWETDGSGELAALKCNFSLP